MVLRGNNLSILLFTLMASVLAQDVSRLHGGTGSTERRISMKFWATHKASLRDEIHEQNSFLFSIATHKASLRDAIHGQNSFLFSIVAERVLAPLRESLSALAEEGLGWGDSYDL